MNKIILNAASWGGNLLLSHTIKANYYKMGVRNFLFTTGNDGFDATIRFYRNTPDKRGVSEMVINNLHHVAYTIVSGNVGNVLIPL